MASRMAVEDRPGQLWTPRDQHPGSKERVAGPLHAPQSPSFSKETLKPDSRAICALRDTGQEIVAGSVSALAELPLSTPPPPPMLLRGGTLGGAWWDQGR